MNNYFLELHERLMKSGRLSRANGLCNEIEVTYEKIFDLLAPTSDDLNMLDNQNFGTAYWACGLKMPKSDAYKRATEYTPLRQTIILFCHEILNRP